MEREGRDKIDTQVYRIWLSTPKSILAKNLGLAWELNIAEMDRMEKRSTSSESTKKGPWFQGSQHFKVTIEIKKAQMANNLEFKTAALCSNFSYLSCVERL